MSWKEDLDFIFGGIVFAVSLIAVSATLLVLAVVIYAFAFSQPACTNMWGPDAEWHLQGGCLVPYEGEMLPARLVEEIYTRNLSIELESK